MLLKLLNTTRPLYLLAHQDKLDQFWNKKQLRFSTSVKIDNDGVELEDQAELFGRGNNVKLIASPIARIERVLH